MWEKRHWFSHKSFRKIKKQITLHLHILSHEHNTAHPLLSLAWIVLYSLYAIRFSPHTLSLLFSVIETSNNYRNWKDHILKLHVWFLIQLWAYLKLNQQFKIYIPIFFYIIRNKILKKISAYMSSLTHYTSV